MKIQPHNYLGLTFSTEMREKIFAKQNEIIDAYPEARLGREAKPLGEDPFKEFFFVQVIKQLIFLEFPDLETVMLKPNAKIGTKKQGNYLNGTKQNVTIVDSTWNKIMIR